MLKVYGSKMCPDCIALEKNFKFYKIEYEYYDVLSSLRYLHDFLVLRDTLPVFDRLKKIHDIGLPAVIKEDGTVFTDWESYLKELGYKPLEVKSETKYCSMDHKGC